MMILVIHVPMLIVNRQYFIQENFIIILFLSLWASCIFVITFNYHGTGLSLHALSIFNLLLIDNNYY